MSWTKEQHITKSNDRVDVCRKAVGVVSMKVEHDLKFRSPIQ